MNSNQTRPNRIGSIDLELLRSSKTITSREVDNLDKRSHSTRGTIKSPTITTSENTPQKGEALTFHKHETIKLDMPHDDALVIALEIGASSFQKFSSIPKVLLTSFHKKHYGCSNNRPQRSSEKRNPSPVSKGGQSLHLES
ncbi:hypothetical protein F2Q69_00029976 [Brassica cretica]|uniref:Uncharacterized protein n=1 Tax=Brassica cretica TaxID=69181 RepID=A0A8S9RW96_BRACR|nr:hypothetical protein F2Q69_00029976 [Brassica cretica]